MTATTSGSRREYGALWQGERQTRRLPCDDHGGRDGAGGGEHGQPGPRRSEGQLARQCDTLTAFASRASNQRHLVRARDLAVENRGLLLIMAAQLFFASTNLSVKFLNSLEMPIPTLELVFLRMGGTLVCGIIYTVYARVPNPVLGPKEVRSLLITRGLCGFLYLFPNYWALKYISLSDDTTLSFLNPLVTAVFARIFLKEAYSTKQACAAVCSLFGVILIARPPFLFAYRATDKMDALSDSGAHRVTPTLRLIAVGAALLSVLGMSMAQISMRAIGKRAHPMHMMNYFSLWCVLAAGPGMIISSTEPVFPRRWEAACLLILMSIFGFLAQILLTMGLQRETAARGSMGVYVQVIFAAVLEFAFFGTVPSPLTVIGAGVIIACAMYVVLSKHPQDDVMKIREPVIEEGSPGRQQSDESQSLLSN